jgi:uncharacterized membrane protein
MMFFVWLPFLLLIPLVMWLVRPAGAVHGCGIGHAGYAAPTATDPLDIARQRLARGEITPGEYQEIVRVLSAR